MLLLPKTVRTPLINKDCYSSDHCSQYHASKDEWMITTGRTGLYCLLFDNEKNYLHHKLFRFSLQTKCNIITDFFGINKLVTFKVIYFLVAVFMQTYLFFPVLLALQWWMRGCHARFIWSSALAILVFRAELCLFLGLLLMMELGSRRLSITYLLKHGILATIVWLSESNFTQFCFDNL